MVLRLEINIVRYPHVENVRDAPTLNLAGRKPKSSSNMNYARGKRQSGMIAGTERTAKVSI